MVKKIAHTFIRFDTVHECDRLAERRTDRHSATAGGAGKEQAVTLLCR